MKNVYVGIQHNKALKITKDRHEGMAQFARRHLYLVDMFKDMMMIVAALSDKEIEDLFDSLELVDKNDFVADDFREKYECDANYWAEAAMYLGISLPTYVAEKDLKYFVDDFYESRKGNGMNIVIDMDSKRVIIDQGEFHEEIGFDIIRKSSPQELEALSDKTIVRTYE